jgi:hypothetical protein
MKRRITLEEEMAGIEEMRGWAEEAAAASSSRPTGP